MEIRTFRREHIAGILNTHITAPPDGVPFFMNGPQPETTLNRWLFELNRRGCESPLTWRNYATEVRIWAEFLLRNNRHYLEDPLALRGFFFEYRALRLSGEDPYMPIAITRASWNTKLAAIANLYDWLNANRIVDGYPYERRTATIRTASGVAKTATTNSAKAKTGRKNATIRYLTPEYVDFFINVGLRGLTPDRTPDPEFNGRNAQRNAVIAQTLFSTGMRVSELTNLLIWEVPSQHHMPTDHVPLPLPGSITKRNIPRQTWIAGRDLNDLNAYMSTERALLAGATTWMPAGSPIAVESSTATGLRINGRHRRLNSLSIGQRQRLLAPDGTSAAIFLATGGAPISVDAIQYIFKNAADRCRSFDPQFPHVHPHMTRHTFAVTTLRALIRSSILKIQTLERSLRQDARTIAHRIAHDPLLVVRDLMGHSSVATTQIYLDIINPESIITQEELDLLGSDYDE